MSHAEGTDQGAVRTLSTEWTDDQRACVVKELNLLLADQLFKNSKRCTVLLRAVVERALAGDYEAIKERILAVEIFGRHPGYDASADPIVRMTANEIRKRLAQYYQQSDRHGNVRIDLHPGSYAPVFSLHETKPDKDPASHRVNEASPSPEEVIPDSPLHPPAAPPPRRLRVKMILTVFGLLAAAVAVAVSAWRVTAADDLLKLFWDPVLKSPNPALLCMGELRPLPNDPQNGSTPATSGSSRITESNSGTANRAAVVVLDDAVSLTNISGLLLIEGKPFNIYPESDTTYGYLQKGPVILLGAFDNDWTMHFTRSMRYYFTENQDGYQYIADLKNPEARLGLKLKGANRPQDFARVPRQDYALVGRLLEPETKQPIIIVAGITASATLAASKFVTDRKLMSDFLKSAPHNWQNKNIEIVFSANVIANQPGPAHVMASAFW